MIGFSFLEIINSLLYSFIYGLGASALYVVVSNIYLILKSLPDLFYEIIIFDKILPSPNFKKCLKVGKKGPIFAFVSVFLFFIGFMLVSYFALDGEIRLYMLILSSAAFYVFYSTFYDILKNILIVVSNAFIFIISTTFRLAVMPFKIMHYILNNKIARN